MSDRQPDLFSGSGVEPHRPVASIALPHRIAPAELDDTALLDAIPASGVMDGPALATEAGRRRLAAAILVLQDYCRRFAGFGMDHALPEQVAALDALVAIGGSDAARAVTRIITSNWVQGSTLASAAAAAAKLHSRLPVDIVLTLLRHADPKIRADACRLARSGPNAIATLIDLLGDLHHDVSMAAACALGHMARTEALPILKRALGTVPSPPVIEAIPPIADEECIVLLGRIARASPDLAGAARDALDAIHHPLAERLSARLRDA